MIKPDPRGFTARRDSNAIHHSRVLGSRILVAGCAQEGLRILARNTRIDLLFTDLVMPGGISGKQRANVAVKARPNLKVLFTSGYTDNAIMNDGRVDPGVNLLSKPYRLADLARAVRNSLS